MVSKTEPFGISVSEYQRLTPYGRHSSCRLWRRLLVTSGVKRWPTKARNGRAGRSRRIDPQDGFGGFAGNRAKPHRRELMARQARPLAFAYGSCQGTSRGAVLESFERARRQPVILMQKIDVGLDLGARPSQREGHQEAAISTSSRASSAL